MTEPTNNVQKGKDERPVQYLGDPGVIYSLCFSAGGFRNSLPRPKAGTVTRSAVT